MKKLLSILLVGAMVFSMAACGDSGNTSTSSSTSVSEVPFVISEDPVVVSVEPEKEKEEEKVEVIPENSYRSELTNEWISNDLKDQRPVAVMIDNEITALPHYGTSDADIVYEMINSTKNNRITRFMCIFKDWQNIETIGNIRSARPTNCALFAEYNAILVHDGGPYYINQFLAEDNAKDHLSGGFARIDRGKGGTYEEYATNEHYKGVGEYAGKEYKSLLERIEAAKFSTEYNKYYMGTPLNFSDKEISLKDEKDAVKAETIKLSFPHNSSTLTYDSKTGLYVYSEYDKEYVDALYDDGRGLAFKNLIIYVVDMNQLDENGYMIYNVVGNGNVAYYCTGGYAVPITWEKKSLYDLTVFKRQSDKSELVLNTGKTYIAICPTDTYKSDLIIK